MDILMIPAIICAYFVKGMCGFANTLVFGTIMGFKANNVDITPIDLLLGFPSNLIITWKERKSLSTRAWLPMTLMVLLGMIPGAFFLKNGDVTLIKLIFGLVVTGLGIEMFVRERFGVKQHKSSRVAMLMIGLASGLMCGLFGIGALLAAYMSRTTSDNSSFRGNMCMVFVIEDGLRIILYACIGMLTPNVMMTALKLLPFMIIGLGSGMLLSRVLDEKKVKFAVIIMLILSGISLLASNILKFFA